jgi:hypothetical protein
MYHTKKPKQAPPHVVEQIPDTPDGLDPACANSRTPACNFQFVIFNLKPRDCMHEISFSELW